MPDALTPAELDAQYLPAPEFTKRDGVPEGELSTFEFESREAFPGTTRTIQVYVPAQYDGTPACLFLALDGLVDTTALDNLIHAGDIPVMIGIGVGSGAVASRTGANPRYQRSLEFDTMSGELARLVLDEVLPAVEARASATGIPLRISADPDDRMTYGGSTGGIGSFTLAWERPDAFRRVATAIGTFVGMRGGDRYPVVVRKTEPKPIRIFMQGGEHDGLPGFLDEVGDWWIGNVALQRALEYAGYDVRHEFGRGTHSGRHMAAVFGDAMRWLWRDRPEPIPVRRGLNTFLAAALREGEDWEALDAADAPAGLASEEQTRATGFDGTSYTVDPEAGTLRTDRVGAVPVTVAGLAAPAAVAVSPDGLWLAVGERDTGIGYSYRIAEDGSLEWPQSFYVFHGDESGRPAGTSGWVFDRTGVLYAATAAGVQLFDRNGRVRAILPSPDRSRVVAIRFGAGDDLDVLFIRTARDAVFRRRLGVSGVASGEGPVELPEWMAG